MKKRKIFKKTTKGVKIVYVKKKVKLPRCVCGAVLHGIPSLRSSQIRKLSKSEKGPERPYGGNLCSKCMRLKIIERYRK